MGKKCIHSLGTVNQQILVFLLLLLLPVHQVPLVEVLGHQADEEVESCNVIIWNSPSLSLNCLHLASKLQPLLSTEQSQISE